MKLQPSSYFLIFLIILGAIFLAYSLSYPKLDDKLLGTVASTIMIGAAIPQLVTEIRRTKKAVETEEKPQRKGETATVLRRFGIVLLWTVGFAMATYLLGLLISIPLFIISYLKWQHTRWWVAITVAIITTAVIYTFFEVVLVRPLWSGIVPLLSWLMSFVR